MTEKELVDLVFNPITATPFLLGLIAGAGGGYRFATTTANKLIELLRSEAARDRDRATEATDKLKEVEGQLAQEKAKADRDRESYQASYEALQKKVGTIRCSICGSSMTRMKETPNPDWKNSFIVELKCSGEKCGQIMDFNREHIKGLVLQPLRAR